MPPILLTFRLIPGLRFSAARVVGVLEGHGELDAWSEYDNFVSKTKAAMSRRMERWALPSDTPTKWFHGFPNDRKHDQCFVFKFGEHRLYGFLCNPQPRSNPRFRLCVLTIYRAKHEWETDDSVLPQVEQWRTNPASREAVAHIYPEY